MHDQACADNAAVHFAASFKPPHETSNSLRGRDIHLFLPNTELAKTDQVKNFCRKSWTEQAKQEKPAANMVFTRQAVPIMSSFLRTQSYSYSCAVLARAYKHGKKAFTVNILTWDFEEKYDIVFRIFSLGIYADERRPKPTRILKDSDDQTSDIYHLGNSQYFNRGLRPEGPTWSIELFFVTGGGAALVPYKSIKPLHTCGRNYNKFLLLHVVGVDHAGWHSRLIRRFVCRRQGIPSHDLPQ